MVTGDNVRTAISVARECGLVSHSASVYIPAFANGNSGGPHADIIWSSVDDEKLKLNSYTLKPLVPTQTFGYEVTDHQQADYQLAVTGDVFRWVLDYAPLETMQRVSCPYCPMNGYSRIDTDYSHLDSLDAGQRRHFRSNVSR